MNQEEHLSWKNANLAFPVDFSGATFEGPSLFYGEHRKFAD